MPIFEHFKYSKDMQNTTKTKRKVKSAKKRRNSEGRIANAAVTNGKCRRTRSEIVWRYVKETMEWEMRVPLYG